jgi:hypothetical protein
VGDLTPTSGRFLGTVNDGNVATTAVFFCYGQGSTFSSLDSFGLSASATACGGSSTQVNAALQTVDASLYTYLDPAQVTGLTASTQYYYVLAFIAGGTTYYNATPTSFTTTASFTFASSTSANWVASTTTVSGAMCSLSATDSEGGTWCDNVQGGPTGSITYYPSGDVGAVPLPTTSVGAKGIVTGMATNAAARAIINGRYRTLNLTRMTDLRASAAYNKALSARRAAAVKNELLALLHQMGETLPVTFKTVAAGISTKFAGLAANRRTEISGTPGQ